MIPCIGSCQTQKLSILMSLFIFHTRVLLTRAVPVWRDPRHQGGGIIYEKEWFPLKSPVSQLKEEQYG